MGSRKHFVGFFLFSFLFVAYSNGANLIANPGFETPESTSGSWPGSFGDWNGDSSAIVGTTYGIVPAEGSKMLQFVGTGLSSSGGADSCQVLQLINVSSYQTLISAGKAKAILSASFNRVAGDSQIDTKYNLSVMGYNGSASTFPSRWNTYGFSGALGVKHAGDYYLDALTSTWETISVEYTLPVGTTFIAIQICMSEDVYNDYNLPEFDGHFVDAVSLEIIPEPTTMLLFGAGLMLFRKR
ncbi:MAG: hypothetical protein A2Y12_06470 [Planctomycetes bacterium GWF2_42_9]|nr:MAG: hypothetical protein A2Y12_06470 [Planctomycetes bacterium GWF2_42_9]HAL45303.1 hypothetical protein [Phycisphaerales bacterium]